MKKFYVIIISVFLISNICDAAILFYDDAEDRFSTNDWYIRQYDNTISVSTEQSRAGSSSYKFVNGPHGDTQAHCELLLIAGSSPIPIQNFPYNQEFWIGYSIFIPAMFVPSPEGWGGLNTQFHAAPDACDSNYLNPTGGMFLNLDTGGFRQVIIAESDLCSDKKNDRYAAYESAPYKIGQWNDVVMHFKFDYRSANNPFFETWLNGVKFANDSGINCWNDTRGPRFHIGNYVTPLSGYVSYYDEIRIGDSNSSYAEVAPGGETATNPLTITTSTLGTWTQGSTSSGTLAATGGTSPYTWAKVSGPTEFTVNAATGAWSITPTTSGTYTVQVRCTDIQDNTITKTLYGSITQTITPTPPSVTAFDLPASSATLEIPVTAFTGSATTTAYMILESPGTPLANDSRWSVTAPTSVTAADVGNRTFYAYVKDADGQVSAPAIDGTEVVIISIDTEIVTGWTETATDNVWSAACSITPKTVYFDSALGIKVTALVDVTSPHVWYYSTGTLYTYSTTDPDTAYTTITASTDVTPAPVTPAEGVITTGGNKTITTTGEKVLGVR